MWARSMEDNAKGEEEREGGPRQWEAFGAALPPSHVSIKGNNQPEKETVRILGAYRSRLCKNV